MHPIISGLHGRAFRWRLEPVEKEMAHFEQLVCGTSPENPGQGRAVVARSPGLGGAATEEIVGYCSGWGIPVAGEFNRPAVLSFPLQATMPSMKGQLFAVIRVAPSDPLLFHAVILSRSDFRDFNYDPFAVVDTGIFLDSWGGGMGLARGQLPPAPDRPAIHPSPNPDDVGLADEALLVFLSKGRLILDLEQASAESDRTLRLLVAAMPLARRETLRFASFAPPGENRYTLAASYARNTPFAGWRRIFLTTMSHGTQEDVRRYVDSLREGLKAGILDGVPIKTNPGNAAAGVNQPGPRPVLEPVAGGRPGAAPRPAPAPEAGVKKPLAAAVVTGPSRASKPASRAFSDVRRTGPVAPAREPRSSRLVRQALPMHRPKGGRRSPAVGVFLVVVALLAAGWTYLDRTGKGVEWGIFDLANLGGETRQESQSPSLLDVVDVGKKYNIRLRGIQRSKLVPGSDRDQALRRAQAELLAEVAGPLLIQVEVYLKVAEAGIQQGSRPDREQARLVSLENQGLVLAAEMGRLELAYYSFEQGVLWQDLHHLSDSGVAARRDSLEEKDGPRLAAVSREVGTGPFWRPVRAAGRNVAGMASLLALFHAEKWSEDWQVQMKRAAEKVSPTASPMSRAYRNNAFTLVRLKKAEHHAANLASVYAGDYRRGGWASPAVKDILPELRKRAALFSSEELPALLAGTLRLHAGLEALDGLVPEVATDEKILRELENNPAVRFDPDLYLPHLERVAYEGMVWHLEQGRLPSELPDHLRARLDPTEVVHFQLTRNGGASPKQWRELALQAGDDFLAHWASHIASLTDEQLTRDREEFDRAWARCRDLGQDLAARAGQGQDWTSVWVDLDREFQKLLTAGRGLDEGDLERRVQRDLAAAWWRDLGISRPLELQTVVIRLEQEQLPGPADVGILLEVGNSGRLLPSRTVHMGPAAPQGTGWVGTVNLDWQVDVAPGDALIARVMSPGGDAVLLEVNYPSLADRVGPGGLGRQQRADSGSLVFTASDSWWRTLPLPEIP
jgi:hypothetical protein